MDIGITTYVRQITASVRREEPLASTNVPDGSDLARPAPPSRTSHGTWTISSYC